MPKSDSTNLSSAPELTVLIPVKNGSKFLEATLESVLSQKTEFSFETLVVNDHSTDSTDEIADRFSKKFAHVKYVNSTGYGVGAALRFGLELVRTKYVARIDSDDLMLPGRLQAQRDFLEANPNIGIVGSQLVPISDNPDARLNHYFASDFEIRQFMPHGNPFADPSVMFRSSFLPIIGNFSARLDGAEQYDYWMRLAYVSEVANLEVPLTEYRLHAGQFTQSKKIRVLFTTLCVQGLWLTGFRQCQIKRRLRVAKNYGLVRPLSYWRLVTGFLLTLKFIVRVYI